MVSLALFSSLQFCLWTARIQIFSRLFIGLFPVFDIIMIMGSGGGSQKDASGFGRIGAKSATMMCQQISVRNVLLHDPIPLSLSFNKKNHKSYETVSFG